MKKLKELILNFYIDYPFMFDILFTAILLFINTKSPLMNTNIKERGAQLDLISNLIGTNVSLAGFVLAALTIIVTFKSSLKIKGIEDSENALELIFSTHHYKSIVRVFKNAIIEFVLVFICLLVLWNMNDRLTNSTLYHVNLCAITITSLTLIRSLFILFTVLGLESKNRR